MSMIYLKGFKTAFVMALAVAIVGCQGPKKMAKTVEKIKLEPAPEVMEVHGDSVQVTVKGQFPPKSFAKTAMVKFQPILKYGDGKEMALDPLYLKGENVKVSKNEYSNAKTINYKKGGSFTYVDKIEYTEEMKKADMALDYTVKFDSKYDELDRCVSGDVDTGMRGTITTSLTVKPFDDIYFYDNAEPEGRTKKIILYYVVNEGFLRDSVFKGPTGQRMNNIIKDTTFAFRNVIINSYASPDGEYELNKRLTELRANSAMDMVKKEMKKAGIKQANDSAFILRPDGGEDWAGFKNAVSASSISDKDAMIALANDNTSDYKAREQRLRSSPSWNEMKNTILPPLRRSEIVFSGSIPNRPIEKVREIGNNDLKNLTMKEQVLLANETEDMGRKAEIYAAMSQQYPNDWRGPNNYAAVMLKQGRYQEGKDSLEALLERFPDNDTIMSNLGVANRFLKGYDRSKELYQSAQQGGVEEDNNLGILYIKYGDYDAAVSSFEADQCDYNVALAYTLKGDYDVALQKIECIEDKNADVFYLRAITAARKGDKELMLTSLTRAIQMDSKFRQMAKEDLEFRKYNDTPEFQNAIR